MTEQVVVLGSGYAGAGAIKSLEDELDGEADVTWVSDVDYHLVLHESHRCIRDPRIREKITIPVEEIKSRETAFRQGVVESVETGQRVVHLADGKEIQYDYLLVGIGSRTAFFGIEGLEEYAHTLKGLDDALGIHEDVEHAVHEATRTEPARVVIGGAGLSGIQTAGEIAEYRDDTNAPLEICLVEGLDEVFPGNDDSIQRALRSRLEARDVNIMTGEFVGRVDEDTVYVGEDGELAYDVLVWTGGITGREAVRRMNVDKHERNHRLKTGRTFQTEDERVFAIGDTALIEQDGDSHAPPTAQAAWQAAEVVGENIVRAIRNEPLKEWVFDDKGTVISVGEEAVAHDVYVVPFVDTFGGIPARTLKKAIAARWIRTVSTTGRAASAWADM
jgi:NADH dehydrogenase